MRPKTLTRLFTFVALLTLPSLSMGQAAPEPTDSQPTITAIRLISFPPTKPSDGSVEFELVIEGEHLPARKDGVTILFESKDPAHSVTCSPEPCAAMDALDGKEISVKAAAKAGTEITRIRIVQKDGSKDKTVVDTKDFLISIQENPPKPKLPEFAIKLEPETNKEFPNLHSLVITKESGDPDVGFDDNPHRMTVDLMPGGATDISVKQTSREQLDVHYIAAADYKPTSAVVTVYNSSDLDRRTPIAIAINKKTPEDPDKPKITRTEIVFIDRSHGIGRLRIFGQGFGDHGSPPYQVDDYLWNCLERFHIRGTDPKKARGTETLEMEARLKACANMLNGTPDTNTTPSERKKELDYTKTDLSTFVKPREGGPEKEWDTWAQRLRDTVTVSVHSRNPDIQVEKVEVIDINDQMIDVYFEFTRFRGFSYPLRLESSSLTIKKKVQMTTQTVKNDKLTATVTDLNKIKTYSLDYDIEPKRDPNLTYKYTILGDAEANTLLGKGVADNFYVLQLSVVNNGEKKVNVPLASIQAEVVWIRGVGNTKNPSDSEQPGFVSYVQGPSTLAPVPLAAVTSNFEAYQKVKSPRAYFFNALDAATIVATALVPFTGPAVKDAEVFFSGGFVPGAHKFLGDLSSQQLQNLTSLSWENSETLPAKGGAAEKLVYIAKRSQEFRSSPVKAIAVPTVSTSQIASILGLEVTGYEIDESTAKSATPAAPTTPATPTGETEPSSPASPAPQGKKPATQPKNGATKP